jgi:DNA-binding winged helix-turn-helix (wHTH) protein/tetratricopeptide (TPR) repeat protein
MAIQGNSCRLGPYEVRAATRELYRGGIKVKLRPQPFQVLQLLVERDGGVVTREELRRLLWTSETFVDFEQGLNTAIKELRGVLNDSASESRYIETVPKLGYRLIVPVERSGEARQAADDAAGARGETAALEEDPAAQTVPPTAPRGSRRGFLVAFAVATLVAAVAGYLQWSRSRVQAEVHVQAAPNPEARDLYHQGRFFWSKRTPDGIARAIECFQKAAALDPTYAPAYSGLADSYALSSGYTLASQNEMMPKARTAALRALELDERLAEAHASLALVAQNYDWDWETSEKEFRRAIALDPNYATAHHWYAEHLALQGRFAEAFPEMERARQLEPLSLIMAADNGALFYFSRQYDRAIEEFQRVLEMEPNFPRAYMVTYAYTQEGRFEDARARIEAWRAAGDTPLILSQVAYIEGRQGQAADARAALEKLREIGNQKEIDPAPLVVAYLGLGEKQQAILWLRKALAEHSPMLTALKIDPIYDPLRSDPRFQELLRRVGLDR